MTKPHLIGLSTTNWFDYGNSTRKPLFEKDLPAGLLYCISDKVIPCEEGIEYVVVDRPVVDEVAHTLKEKMRLLAARLDTHQLRLQIGEDIRNEMHKMILEQDSEEQSHAELSDRITTALCGRNSLLTSRLERAISELLKLPLQECLKKNKYKRPDFSRRYPAARPDGSSAADFKIETGIPGTGHLPKLIFDLYLAKRLKADVVLNSLTKNDLRHAKRLLSYINDGDLASYISYMPK